MRKFLRAGIIAAALTAIAGAALAQSISTLTILDANGVQRTIRVIDLSGSGGGPFMSLYGLVDKNGNPNDSTHQIFTGRAQLATPGVTISNGQSLSPAVDLGTGRLKAILMPAAWTAASLSFQASPDGVTYGEAIYQDGTAISATVAAAQYIIVDGTRFEGARYIKIRSGTSGSPVNQGADRALTLVASP